MKHLFTCLAALLYVLHVSAQEPYFTQTFDEKIALDGGTFLESTSAYPYTWNVEGQGEWILHYAYVVLGSEMKTNYVKDGSAGDLRIVKNNRNDGTAAYIISPILNKGVKKITLDENRSKKYLNIYTSTDGGKSWKLAQSYSKNTTQNMTIEVNSLEVNRVKVENPNGSNDCDIDNLTIYPEAVGTAATLTTGDATNVTKNTADLTGVLVDAGDQEITEMGILYATTETPSVADNKLEVENTSVTSFTLGATGLKASTTYYYRAYAFSAAGYAYGEVKSFTTADATPAVVLTQDVTYTTKKAEYVGRGMVTDDGGLDLTEVGIVYGETAGVTTDNAAKVVSSKIKAAFNVVLPLEEGNTYYVRAYAVTSLGTSYGEEKQVTASTSLPETPDLAEKIWCSPDGDDGSADGSETKPFYTIDKAIAIVEPGQRICMKAGTYVYDHRINIDDTNGEPDAYIELFAVPYNGEERAVLDFSAQPYHAHSDNPYQGIRLTSSYWHFYKIDICNASDNGLLIERNKPTGGSAADIIARTQDGHDNIIEECNFYKNGDTGLQIKNLGSYNKIINCDSYLNCDEDNGDADGFAPKISVGDGNYFYGCRAWLNSDDGYDVFFKKDGNFEDNKTIIFENCIASRNGKFEDGTTTQGNANGFKMGSNQGRMNVVLNRCIASCNGSKGFDQNHNTGDIIMNNCTGFTRTDQVSGKSVKYSYSYKIYEDLASGSICQLNNCIAINDNYENGKDQNGVDAKKGKSEWGGIRVDEAIASLTTSNLKSDPTWFVDLSNFEELEGARDADGNIPETTFAHIDLTKGTALIDAGTVIGENSRYASTDIIIPAIAYEGSAPDLGAYETKDLTAIGRIASAKSNGNRVKLVQCQNGLVVVSVEGATAADVFQLSVYDANGRTIGQHQFNATGSVHLPAVKGMMMLHVTGHQVDETIKTIVY